MGQQNRTTSNTEYTKRNINRNKGVSITSGPDSTTTTKRTTRKRGIHNKTD